MASTSLSSTGAISIDPTGASGFTVNLTAATCLINRSAGSTFQIGSSSFDLYVNSSGLTSLGTSLNPSSRQLYVSGAIESTSGYYGTLQTASQPSVTTLGGLTSIQGQTISSSAWQYVNSMNQSVASTASPSYSKLTLTGSDGSLPSGINIKYTAGSLNLVGPQYSITSSGNRRWNWYIGTAESSGNAGSNLILGRYDDSGTYLSDSIAFNRANNTTTISGPLSVSTTSDNSNGNITSGEYTPTLANNGNVTAAGSTANLHKYVRVGNYVTVTGSATIQSSSAGATSFAFTLTLPFSQGNFSGTTDASGTGACAEQAVPTNRTGCNVASINATQTINIVTGVFTAAPGTGTNAIFVNYCFQYRVR